uniref:Uncharacterized protein n=1 Tax=Anguilla anguilla TaxID=7936 RepID=A0A0E9U550_ANGAN
MAVPLLLGYNYLKCKNVCVKYFC